MTACEDFTDNLLRIGNRAFYGCTNFQGWSYIPRTITEIGDYAFYNCTMLGWQCDEGVYLPDCVVKIGNGAFQNCTSLRILLCNNYQSSGRLTIGSYAFAGCTELWRVEIVSGGESTSTVELGTHCFENCSELSNCYIDVYGTIPQYAFANCTKLAYFEDINWYSRGFKYVTTIESWAFQNCKVLGNMDFLSLTTIKPNAFAGCDEVELDVSYKKWSVTKGEYTTNVENNGPYLFHSDISSFVDFTWTAVT